MVLTKNLEQLKNRYKIIHFLNGFNFGWGVITRWHGIEEEFCRLYTWCACNGSLSTMHVYGCVYFVKNIRWTHSYMCTANKHLVHLVNPRHDPKWGCNFPHFIFKKKKVVLNTAIRGTTHTCVWWISASTTGHSGDVTSPLILCSKRKRLYLT